MTVFAIQRFHLLAHLRFWGGCLDMADSFLLALAISKTFSCSRVIWHWTQRVQTFGMKLPTTYALYSCDERPVLSLSEPFFHCFDCSFK